MELVYFPDEFYTEELSSIFNASHAICHHFIVPTFEFYPTYKALVKRRVIVDDS